MEVLTGPDPIEGATEAGVRTLHTPDASKIGGHYAHGRAFGDVIFTSGQIPLDPASNELVTDVREGTLLVLNNLLAIVEAGGGAKESIARVDVFVRSLDDFAVIDRAFADFFGDIRPARMLLQATLAPGAVLEASMVAFAAPASAAAQR